MEQQWETSGRYLVYYAHLVLPSGTQNVKYSTELELQFVAVLVLFIYVFLIYLVVLRLPAVLLDLLFVW